MSTLDQRAAAMPLNDVGVRLLQVVETWRAGLPAGERSSSQMSLVQDMLEQLRQDLERKPRAVVLGEFNSGKTSLVNVLARTCALPTSVLSNTRQPTVIQAGGDPPDRLLAPVRATRGGAAAQPVLGQAFDLDYLHASADGRLLRSCTLIDTPGISDPSFTSPVIARLAALAEIAILCTPATQAWRESERTAWDGFPQRPRWRNLLVLSGADMVRSPDDRRRVLERLNTDTGGRFCGVYPLAALHALEALDPGTGDVVDDGLWRDSGAEALEAAIDGLAFKASQQRRNRAGRWADRLLRQLDRIDDSEFTRFLLRLPVRSRSEHTRMLARASRQDTRALADLRRRLKDLRGPSQRRTQVHMRPPRSSRRPLLWLFGHA